MQISINRALSELKLTNKKIEDKTANLRVAGAVQNMEPDEKQRITNSFIADIQSIRDLISRRNSLKSAIVASNAAVCVTVGDESMTVAQAIERKTSIEFEKALNRRMREGYYQALNQVDSHNAAAKDNADKQANAALGADTEGNKGDQYTAIFDAYYKKNSVELLAPEDIEAQLERDQDKVDSFENEVDFILSESNIKTMIEV